MRSIDFGDPSAGLRQVAGEFDGWSPLLTALVTKSGTEPWLRPVHALPVGICEPCPVRRCGPGG